MTPKEKLRVLLAGHAAFSERDVDGVIRIYAPAVTARHPGA